MARPAIVDAMVCRPSYFCLVILVAQARLGCTSRGDAAGAAAVIATVPNATANASEAGAEAEPARLREFTLDRPARPQRQRRKQDQRSLLSKRATDEVIAPHDLEEYPDTSFMEHEAHSGKWGAKFEMKSFGGKWGGKWGDGFGGRRRRRGHYHRDHGDGGLLMVLAILFCCGVPACVMIGFVYREKLFEREFEATPVPRPVPVPHPVQASCAVHSPPIAGCAVHGGGGPVMGPGPMMQVVQPGAPPPANWGFFG